VIIDTAGNLYGAINGGGAYGCGTVFELMAVGGTRTFALIYNVAGDPLDDQAPNWIDAIDAAGNLFETIGTNGAYGVGAIFQLSPRQPWTYTSLHDFTCGSDGGFLSGGNALDAYGNSGKRWESVANWPRQIRPPTSQMLGGR
jgi:hypothetical protein